MGIELKASFAYTISNILQRSLSFITLPLFTRLLTTEQYGQSTVYSSWETILTLCITLYLAYGSFSKAMVKFENDRGKYIAAINGLCTTIAVVFCLIYIPFRKFFNLIFELPTFIILIMVLSIIFNNALICWQGKARFEYKYQRVISVTLIMTVITPVIAYFFIINSSEKGYARIVASAGITIIFGMFVYLYYLIKEKTFYNREYWRYALRFNIPLIPYYLSQSIFNQSDRIMISHIGGQDKAAIYGVAYTLAMLLQIVLNSINNAYTPWFYKRLKDGMREKNRAVSNGIALLMSLLLLGVITVTPEIIQILATKEYMEAIWVVPPVAMSVLFLYYTQLFVNFEFYYEEKRMLVYGTVGSAIINIVLNLIFIPKFGFIAAAYTTLVSYILFMWMNYKMYKKILTKYNIADDMFDYKSLTVIAILFVSSGFFIMVFYKLPIIRYFVIVLLISIFVFKWERIKSYILNYYEIIK